MIVHHVIAAMFLDKELERRSADFSAVTGEKMKNEYSFQ